ncbi:unnamed protein product [Cunninghamella blakesleeana]
MIILYLLIIFNLLNQCLASSFIQLDLQPQMNHRACGDGADVDNQGNYYIKKNNEPAVIKVGGALPYLNPLYGSNDHNDNIQIQQLQNNNNDEYQLVFEFSKMKNQLNQLNQNRSSSNFLKGMYFLISASHGPITAEFKINYNNGEFYKTQLVIPDWQEVVSFSSSHQVEKYNLLQRSLSHSSNQGNMYSLPIFINTTLPKDTLPLNIMAKILSSSKTTTDRGNNGEIQKKSKRSILTRDNSSPSIHIFSATAIYSYDNHNNDIQQKEEEKGKGNKYSITITSARATRRYMKNVSPLSPIFILRLHNTGDTILKDLDIEVFSTSIKTIYPGKLKALASSQIALVDIGLEITHPIDKNNELQDIYIKVSSASNHDEIIIDDQIIHSISLALYKSMKYDQTSSSLQQHQAPTWFNDAKFGIFIHWGLFSVPAWAPVGQQYAEWYWWQMNHPNDPTHKYHLETYGSNFTYDDFIPLWKPDQFDPKKWLDLIDASGATYFVFTSKHHDGFSLFNTKVSNRSSIHMNPHRDFVQELITTSKKNYPHLKRGIYFSLPEWYNPYYHNANLPDWGGSPKNPYTNKEVPYTGNPHLNDFVNDLQVPQFLELVHQYEPDILWCDIGGINNSTAWQTEYFNQAYQQNRQVTINDRCGNDVSDFTTLEYRQTDTPPSRFWEATRGIDPRSFGFNKATPPSSYATTEELIHELISTVAMNGNLLLNIGPESNGNVFQTMVDRLKEMGQWLKQHHDSIFNTKPYWLRSQDDKIHYMMGMDHSVFYIFIMDKSVLNNKYHDQLILQTPLPFSSSSSVIINSLSDPKKTSLPWSLEEVNGQNQYQIHLPHSILDYGKYAWVLEYI